MPSSDAGASVQGIPWMACQRPAIFMNLYSRFRASRVYGVFFERLFGVGGAVRLGNPKDSILTLYTLSTLERRKKTKGYRLVAVQGIQGKVDGATRLILAFNGGSLSA